MQSIQAHMCTFITINLKKVQNGTENFNQSQSNSYLSEFRPNKIFLVTFASDYMVTPSCMNSFQEQNKPTLFGKDKRL